MERRWKQAKELALLNNDIARSQYKKYYDRKINERPFKIGDLVMMQSNHNPALQGDRFAPKYVNPKGAEVN